MCGRDIISAKILFFHRYYFLNIQKIVQYLQILYLCTRKMIQMRKYSIADNQELTAFALQSMLKRDKNNEVYHAVDKVGLIEFLKENEDSVVILDYTLFDFKMNSSCSLSVKGFH